MVHLDPNAYKARNKLLSMFLLHLILDALLVAIAQDRWAIGRIFLTIILMYFVLQGRKWAKWFLVGLFSFLMVALITLVIVLSSKLSTILIIGSSILTVLSAIIVIYLVLSQDLNHYFAYKRHASVKEQS